MDRTPKTKIFSLKNKNFRDAHNKKDSSGKNSLCRKDFTNVENLPVNMDELLKTPKLKIDDCYTDNHPQYSSCESPQFKVGWDDGSENAECDSPLYTPPVSRKIRRCPDNLLDRLSKVNPTTIVKRSCENDCDILECVSWAKNLLNDDFSETDKNVLPANILDDSTDELMVLCSQAVEENTRTDRLSKRFKFESNEPVRKMMKNSSLLSGINILPRVDQEQSYSTNSSFKKNISSSSFHPKSNNNNVETDNFNLQKKEVLDDSSIGTSLPHTDLFKCYLEDNGDFNSFDFSCLDAIQTKSTDSSEMQSNSTISKPRKYSKEEIEKRRIEAKKKLLFKRKNKSL